MRRVALSPEQVRALAAGSPVSVDGVPVAWPDDDRRVLRYRLEALDADPASAPYLLHVVLDGDRVVARIGCHEGPRDGGVEIGYYVAPSVRGRGVATALVGEYLAWLASRGVRRVRAAARPDNAASLAVLAHHGFAAVGAQEDDEDGPEIVHEVVLQ
jgi:[ribosomal protein S5]-alanine N-acetyltransferase